jgi:hypothetical protein
MTLGDWLTIIASVTVGQLLLVVVELARHWLTRKQRRDDAHDDFQRQTLLELQEALYTLVHAIANGKLDYDNERDGKPRINWPPAEDPRLLGVGTLGRISLLVERVKDLAVRTLVQQYLEQHAEIFISPENSDEQDFNSHLGDLWKLQERANERIGMILRSL